MEATVDDHVIVSYKFPKNTPLLLMKSDTRRGPLNCAPAIPAGASTEHQDCPNQ
jgi:hypothetical protein